jgi:hypothetical protein
MGWVEGREIQRMRDLNEDRWKAGNGKWSEVLPAAFCQQR